MTPIDLPFPPSTNTLFRNVNGKGRVPTERYKTWKRAADNLWLAQKRGRLPWHGPYWLIIVLGSQKRIKKDGTRRQMDIDNYAKAVSDRLVSWGVVQDDHLADGVAIVWGEAPEGCKALLLATATTFAAEIAAQSALARPVLLEAAE